MHTAWLCACKADHNHINRRAPTRLPLLFALDAKLGVADGFAYALDCKTAQVRRSSDGVASALVIYCGGDFASAASDSSGDGASSGDSGCGGGD